MLASTAAAMRPVLQLAEGVASGDPRGGHGDRSGEVVLAAVDPERRVLGCHQCCVGDDAQDPAVQAEDEVEDRSGIGAANDEHDCGDEYEQADEADPAGPAPEPERAAADEHRGDQVLRDSGEPPADQRQPAALVFGV